MRTIIAIILLALVLGGVSAATAAGNAPNAFDFVLFHTHTA